MWIYDSADLSIKDVNTSAVDLYGYSKEEMLSMTITDLRPESEIPKLKKVLSKRTNNFNNAGIWTHLKKNGDLIIVRVLSHAIGEGDKNYKLVSIQDVTNEVQYQQELQMFMENSLDGIMITSPDGGILKANKATCEMLGMEEEEILKLGRNGMVYNDQKLQQALKKREETGKFSGELTFLHKSGKKIPIELTTSVYKNPQGELRTSMVIRNITDRKLNEIELEKAYSEKETILESIGDGFFAVNNDWVVTYWNSAAERLLNTPKEAILNKNLWSVFKDALDLPSYTHYHKVMNEGVTVNFEDYYEPLSRWYDITAYPSSEGISVYFKDITQQKLKEKELQESLKEKETLLAEVHHRVKNNLAIVSSLMQIQAFEADNAAVSEKLNVSIGRIKTIASIHELLYQSNSFSRLEAENSVKNLITEISKTFEPKLFLVTDFDLQHIELNINQAIPLSLIINEVVTNILKHAFKDTDRGKIEAYMREKNQKVLLRITDNGNGLPKGFPKSDNKNSIGMQLIDTLSIQLNAEYQFQTVDGVTHFSLTFQKSDLKGSSSGYVDV